MGRAMRVGVLVSILMVSSFCGFAAKANEILTYRSQAFSSGDYITATLQLNCTASCDNGTFFLPPDITSLTISVFSSTNVLLDTLSAPSSGATQGGIIDYVTITDGVVTSWFLDLLSSTSEVVLGSSNDPNFGTQDLYLKTRTQAEVLSDDPGTWSTSPVPGPIVGAGLPGLMFAGAGFLAWLRRQRSSMA